VSVRFYLATLEAALQHVTSEQLVTHINSSQVIFTLLHQGGHQPGKPGILRDFSEHGKLREFSGNSVQPQGKIVTNKVF